MKKNGYVLILALIILSLCTAIITSVLNRSVSHRNFAKIFNERERTKLLALSGIEIAINQITFKKEEEEKKPNPNALLINLLPIINTWQTFNFEQEQGLEGKLQLYIACEQGKIDIGQLYDFAKKQYKQNPTDAKKLLQFLDEQLKKITQKSFFETFDKFIKNTKKPLFEITELAEIEGFKDLYNNLFFSPEQDQSIKLYDLFTVDNGNFGMNPWMLSNSLLNVLGRKNKPTDTAKNELVEKLKTVKLSGDLTKDWNQYLLPLHGIDWNTVNSDFKKIMNLNILPKTFSVFCIATIGSVSQKIFAILAQDNIAQGDQLALRIKRIYWI
ncbi:hypothetical protein M1446_04970 [Candidatus Dependentiae bacterium]|nr:hypothetical protein [Candidatus Dependentiae bacterium]